MADAYRELRAAQDSGLRSRAIALLGEAVVARLGRSGLLEVGVLDGLSDVPADELDSVFLVVAGEVNRDLLPGWHAVVAAAVAPAFRRRRVLALAPPEFGSSWSARLGLVLGGGGAPTPEASGGSSLPPPPAGHPIRWPTRGRRAAALAVGAADARGAEEAERRRWVGLAVDLLVEARLPVALFAERSLGGAAAAASAFGGRRLRTLRLRVRQMQRTIRWLTAAGLGGFPMGEPGVAAFLAYVRDMVESDAARSLPSAAVHALRFFETRGGVVEEAQVARHPLVLGAVSEAEGALASGRTRLRHKAFQYSAAMVEAMERHVLNDSVASYVRVFAWVRLVRVWTATRADDIVRVSPSDVVLVDGCLQLTLRRTKTTGPGKRLEVVVAFVSASAWLAEPTWLAVGFDLFRTIAPDAGRDYLLPLPSAGLAGCRSSPAGYTHTLAMGRILLRELVGLDGVPLMAPATALLWTEHSPRMVVPTWGGALGVESSILDRFGRWTDSGARGYVRSDRAIVVEAQARIAVEVRLGVRKVFVQSELDLRRRVEEFLVLKGIDRAQAALCAARAVDRGPRDDVSVRARGGGAGPLGLVLEPASGSLGGPSPVASSPTSEGATPRGAPSLGVPGSDSEASVGEAPPEGALVVSITMRSGRRTLHRLPGCGRRPGVDYKRFEVLDGVPAPCSYTHVCRQCWPGAAPLPAGPSSPSTSSASSASSESSTSSARGPS